MNANTGPPRKRDGAVQTPSQNLNPQLAAENKSCIASAQVCNHTPLVCANAPTKRPDELWVLTRPLGTTDAIWNEQYTIVGSPERIRGLFDLSRGVPWPWRLFKGKKARRFLRDSLKEEQRFRRDLAAREKAPDN